MYGFVAELLRHQGALVEAVEPDSLEVLAPPSVQSVLEVGELSHLAFGSTAPTGAQRVGLESNWLDRCAALLGAQGRWTRRVLVPVFKAPADMERLLSHELILDNATYRLLGASPAWTRYLVLDFRASAVSNEKRDFVLRLGVNLATGAMPDAVIAAFASAIKSYEFDEATLDQNSADTILPGEVELPEIWPRARLLDVIGRALHARLEAALDPFVKGLHRRLGRDQDRLHEYHNDLHHEAMRRALGVVEDDPKRRREKQRAEAIAREYRGKLDDLARQYSLRVTVDWVQTQELIMPVQRLAVQIRRRKGDRTIWLDWNPLARRLEPPVCEASASSERPRLVCDEALHLLVPAALAACPGCGRPFCRACHANGCPKCGADKQPSLQGGWSANSQNG